MKEINIRIERWPLSQLAPSETNPRTHSAGQVAQIAGSITTFGFLNPILVTPDGTIIAGEGRYRAARLLDLQEIPVIVLEHLSEVQRHALAIADNQIALNAGWDEQKLREQLAALHNEHFDLALLGFDDAELAQRLADQDAAGLTDEDEIPAIPINPVTRQGDLWVLSAAKGRRHRLLCGDATNAEDAARLLGGQQVPVLMVTDPPYGVGLEPEWRESAGLNLRTRQGGTVINDDRVDWSPAWALFPGDVAYVWHAGIHAAEVALGLQSCDSAVWFAYSPDRKGEHPAGHLEKYAGILQADGYAGFNKLYEKGRIRVSLFVSQNDTKCQDFEK